MSCDEVGKHTNILLRFDYPRGASSIEVRAECWKFGKYFYAYKSNRSASRAVRRARKEIRRQIKDALFV